MPPVRLSPFCGCACAHRPRLDHPRQIEHPSCSKQHAVIQFRERALPGEAPGQTKHVIKCVPISRNCGGCFCFVIGCMAISYPARALPVAAVRFRGVLVLTTHTRVNQLPHIPTHACI